MPKVLIVHGAGMNMRGKAQIEVHGPMTLPQYDEHIRKYASELGIEVEIFHSNIEGEVINKFYDAHDRGGGCGHHQSCGLLIGPSRTERRDQPRAFPDHRSARLEPGAARQPFGGDGRKPRRGDGFWCFRLLPRFARHQGHTGIQVTIHPTMKNQALYKRGLKTRLEVLGKERQQAIAREEDDFSRPLREFTTQYVWGELWSRKGIPRKTRCLINVALLVASKCARQGGQDTHIRAALINGCTKVEIREVLLQCAVYAGVPVMREAVTRSAGGFRGRKEARAPSLRKRTEDRNLSHILQASTP